tara:strand:- start:255 stop:557 length:303 start_codon:yes stop_codon:yes gene_type:complete
MTKKPTKKQMNTATNILVSWKKKMPFYYASAIIIVFLILIFATKNEKEISMYQKNILDFKKAAKFINSINTNDKRLTMFEKNILDFKKAAEYIHRNVNKS